MRLEHGVLAVKLEAGDDLVDHLALGAHPDRDFRSDTCKAKA